MTLNPSNSIRTISRSAVLSLAFAGISAGAAQMFAQAPSSLADLPSSSNDAIGKLPQPISVEILSDSRGVDLQPYIAQVIKTVSAGWAGSAQASQVNGFTEIRVQINSSGNVEAMHLDGSSGNVALDWAAWTSITQVKSFQPLPASIAGQMLSLRICYKVSKTS